MDMDFVLMVIDVFLLEGFPCFIRVILSLLEIIKEKILELDMEECMVYLKTFAKDVSIDLQSFF